MVDCNIIGYIRLFKKGDIQAIINVDYASDLINRKSIRGYVITIFRDTVCFSSTKPRFVTSSIMNAEYITLSLAF